MKQFLGICAVLSILLITSGCATVEPPAPDPVKEELAVLQKQLLELQKLQNDTKAKLDESNATIAALSAKVETMETRQAVQPASQPKIEPKPATLVQEKKKPAKKVKKKKAAVRRQE